MSLTSILVRPEVRAQLRAIVRPWSPSPSPSPALVRPGTGHRGVLGMAFEFALAAGLRARSSDVTGAFGSPDLALARLGTLSYLDQRAVRLAELAARASWATRILSTVNTGALTREAANACFTLAYLGALARAPSFFLGRLEERAHLLIQEPAPGYIAELQALYAVIPWGSLLAGPILLNPSFPVASGLLGGADADLVCGEVLVEIKTRAATRITPDDVRQAVALAALANVFGLPDPPKGGITTVGFVVARSGIALQCPLADLLAAGAAEQLVDILLYAAAAKASS